MLGRGVLWKFISHAEDGIRPMVQRVLNSVTIRVTFRNKRVTVSVICEVFLSCSYWQRISHFKFTCKIG